MRVLKLIGGLALMALLIASPQATAAGAAAGMVNWYRSVAPALLPFLALMPLLTCSEAVWVYERLLGRATKALFNLPGSAAPAMIIGMLAGTPAGAIAARNVAARSGMNRGELLRTAAAFAGFSPAFLVGGIGAGMLGSIALGWKLLEAQLFSQLTLALLFRRAWGEQKQGVTGLTEKGDEQPVRGAALTVLTIGGYMALFGALNSVAQLYVGTGPASALLCLMDVPSGAHWLAGQPLPEEGKLVLLAGMCGFGGLCVVMQSLGVLGGCGISAVEYIGLRLLAAAINAGIMALLVGGPDIRAGKILETIGLNPYPTALLLAALLAIPALSHFRKSIN